MVKRKPEEDINWSGPSK